MIHPARNEGALRALQAVLLRGRTMAYNGAPHGSIADLLDGAEYLVALIYDPEDMTESYRQYLNEIAERFKCVNAIELLEGSAK